MRIGDLLLKCTQLLKTSSSKNSTNFVVSLGKSKINGESTDCLYGSVGAFSHVENDFTLQYLDANNLTEVDYTKINEPSAGYEKKQVQKPKAKFRFVVATLALIVMSLSLMARILLNVSIVEMTKSSKLNKESLPNEAATTTQATSPVEMEDEPIDLDWSPGAQNLLLASFYFGYPPAIMLSGGLADLYGSKVPLLICGLGSALVSLLTPFAARYSLTLLICLRAALGAFQGALIPACYDLFNRWLTLTETTIFVPLIKVSFAFGTFLGALLPGLILHLGFDWPYFFYVSSIICGLWCLVWIPLATSEPQTNGLVSLEELNWIMRKKKQEKKLKQQTDTGLSELKQIKISTMSGEIDKSTVQVKESKNTLTKFDSSHNNNTNRKLESFQKTSKSSDSTPWIKIICNPSVLALSLVKFTYNVGMDFLTLELATYLRNVHSAPMETISMIASGGCVMQMCLVTFVGWLAKVVVHNESLGLSKTKWRKVFQGSSNFILALVYFGLSLTGQRIYLATGLILVIFFAWMLGAGGEAMVPYDLSAKYPATIVGFAQSISSLAGLMVPTLCGVVLGDEITNLDRWNFLFQLISSALATGGLVFVFVLKAKPFLPDERQAKK